MTRPDRPGADPGAGSNAGTPRASSSADAAPDETGTGAGGERRLTAGERNELRRQERRAARRAESSADHGGVPAGRRGGGSTGKPDGGGRAGGSDGGGRAGGTGSGELSHRGGASGGAGNARTADGVKGAGPTVKVHRHKAVTAAPAATDDDTAYRAGFACFVGRPNAGKSTLINAIIGQKIAITSSKPQTTRHIIRGVLHQPRAQLVLVDTPGLHRPRTLLGERLNDLVRETWSEVDVIGVCFPADEPVGAGDRFISSEMAQLKATIIAVVTKVDLVGPATLAERLLAVGRLYDFADIVPVSAVSGHQVDTLVEVITRHLPESPPLYPDDVLTEEPEQVLIGELIREAALEGVRDELPHSIAVLVEEMLVEGNLTRIYADVYVERDSQKSIVIGTRGARLKDVGIRARAQIEALLGRRVYLDLHVRVAKEWQRDPRQLRRLGF
jgi:GTPase